MGTCCPWECMCGCVRSVATLRCLRALLLLLLLAELLGELLRGQAALCGFLEELLLHRLDLLRGRLLHLLSLLLGREGRAGHSLHCWWFVRGCEVRT